MAWGLRLRDENGNIVLDPSKRITRYGGTIAIPNTNGSFAHPMFVEAGALVWWRLTKLTVFQPRINFNGSSLVWDWGSLPNDKRFALDLMFGLY